MSGVKIAARYGLYPCQLGLCGPEQGADKIMDYLLGKDISEEKIKEILKQFKGAYPYYELIAKSNNKDVFNEQVVKAYWIGNSLLDNVTIDSLREMIVREFSGPGFLSRKDAENKARDIPLDSKPHHSFHVLSIGSVTGTIDLKGKLLDICRITWAKVRDIDKMINKSILWDKRLVPKVEIGDNVSIHWNHLIEVLNKEELENLKKYDQKT